MSTKSTLDGTVFPLNFKYEIPKPLKRTTVTPTAGGINIQQAPALFVEDNIIAWNMDAVSTAVKDTMLAFYNNPASPSVDFIGHNEPSKTYQVKALVIDDVQVRAALWYLSGSFQVISLTP